MPFTLPWETGGLGAAVRRNGWPRRASTSLAAAVRKTSADDWTNQATTDHQGRDGLERWLPWRSQQDDQSPTESTGGAARASRGRSPQRGNLKPCRSIQSSRLEGREHFHPHRQRSRSSD